MRVALLMTDSREMLHNYEATRPEFGTAPTALLEGFSLMPEVEVHVVSCVRQPMKSPKKLAGNIFFHSLPVSKIAFMRTFYLGCIRAVRKKLKEIQPDIVHGQGTERDCAISAVFSGYPNVITIHGNMAELARLFKARVGSFGWLSEKLENFALKRTGGVFCHSEYTERLVEPRAKKTWRVPNALREDFFAPAKQKPGDKCVLLNVGVISPRKRQLELLDVARQLHQQNLKFEFQFIGQANPDTGYAAAFLEKVKAAEREGCARFIGEKSTEELIAAFDQAAALVHFPMEEAFGLVVAESLARNLKFFGARTGGIVDIADGVPGAELFGAGDWRGLSEAIADWIRGGFPRPQNASEIVRGHYHPTIVARRHVEIYKEILRARTS